ATAAGSTATIAGAASVWEASDLITVGPGGAGTLAVRDGGTVAASGLVIGSHGTLRGAGGVVQNHVTNHNLVLAEASPNPFQVNGQLTQNTNGRIRIEIGSPTDFGRLSVEGALILTGTLEVVLVNGYLPAPGTQFDILDWGTRLGTFAAVQLPIGWDASQLYSTGVITAVNPHPPGDFNLDGRVDGADLLLWQRHLAAPFTAGDLTDWKSFFGVAQGAAASAAAVPEPAASVLLLAAAALGRGRRNPRATACQLSAAVRPRCEAIQARDCGRTTPSPFLGE
ncbi:MAG TPA: hypothetical protein PKC18_04950, partial [Lacipirellulaceae bacterium]|nr:hypothetical protein [Lacipirellulaceae bacterium]